MSSLLRFRTHFLAAFLALATVAVYAQNGGAGSAQDSAQAAGTTVSTGSGAADRTAPTTRAGFAQLLSGLFFGVTIFLILAGLLIAQIWTYFESFNRRDADKPVLKFGVAVILFVTLIQIAVLLHRLYDVHVGHFGDFVFPLLTIGWEIATAYICIGISSMIVQIYFVHKCWISYGRSYAILAFYMPLVLWTLAGSIASAALELEAGSAANVKGAALNTNKSGENNFGYLFSVVFATWLVSNACIDVSLCFMLCRQLLKIKSPYFSTRHAIARLIMTFLETCILTAGLSLASMILFLAVPQQFYYLITLLSVGSSYGCSFVATLMLRPSIARELAMDKDSRMTRTNIDKQAASAAAPTTIAKPLLKRIMKREQAKARAMEGIHVVTFREEVRSTTAADVDMREVKGSSSDLNSDGTGQGSPPGRTAAMRSRDDIEALGARDSNINPADMAFSGSRWQEPSEWKEVSTRSPSIQAFV